RARLRFASTPRNDNLFRLIGCNLPHSSQGGGQIREIGYDQIGLMRCLAEWPLAPIDEHRPHAVAFCSDTIEGMIGGEQDAGAILADDLRRLCISLPMRLEIPRLLNRDDIIEAKSDVWLGGLEHVTVAVGQDCQLVAFRPELLERWDDIGKRLQPL